MLARIAGRVVAVEVKARIGADPLTQLTEVKRRRMREAAMRLEPRPDRIDVVAVRVGADGAVVRWLQAVA